MRSRVLLLAMLLLSASAARASHAQGASDTATSHQAAAKELVAALKSGELIVAGMATMVDAQVKQTPQLAPFRDVMLEWARRYITGEAALPEFVKIYAAAFTEAELRELLVFYKTPVGQKLLAQQPDLMRQGVVVGERLAQKYQAELQQMMQARAQELQKDSMPGR